MTLTDYIEKYSISQVFLTEKMNMSRNLFNMKMKEKSRNKFTETEKESLKTLLVQLAEDMVEDSKSISF